MLGVIRKSWALFALFALVALSSAMNIDDVLHIDGIEEYLHHGMKRQAGTGVSETPSETPSRTSEEPTSSQTPPPETTSEPPSSTPSEQPSSEPPSSNPPEQTTSDTPSQTSEPPSSAPSRSTPTSTPTSSKSSAVTTPITYTTPLLSTSVSRYVTIFTTVSDGQQVAVTSTGESTAVVTTGTATRTELPSPQKGGDRGSGGLSETNKKVIGGVVGGVGGAILLGGLAVVAWRIWGRKKRVSEDDDDLMAGTGSALGDKPHSASTGNTPFQQNLEQYHNPGGRPNAAANF